MKGLKYVIIGNSAAAIGCIEGIRIIDKTSEITLISSEPYHTYSRPLISYLLLGKTDEQRRKYRPDGYYEKMGVVPMLGKKVLKIHAENKSLTLDGGQTIVYDKLLVATGSRPFVPPTAGMDSVEKKFTFLSLSDAKALEAAISPTSRVLIVGAGLIGLKCAEGIAKRVASITIVDMANRILPSVLDEHGSALIRSHVEKQGIRFLLDNSVQEFAGGTARLKDGQSLEFDVLVTAVGVRPNTGLVAEAGGEVRRGIVVNANSKTSLPDIYAAGDCTESHDISAGTDRILAILPNAYMQGEAAGISMAGGTRGFEKAIPMNAMGLFGLHMITAGSYEGGSYIESDDAHYKRLITRDNRLVGFILVGDVARAGIYTHLIRDRIPLDTIDFELMKKKPQLMAFQAKDRAKMLGGAK